MEQDEIRKKHEDTKIEILLRQVLLNQITIMQTISHSNIQLFCQGDLHEAINSTLELFNVED